MKQHADFPPGVVVAGLQAAVPEDPEREHRRHAHAIAELRGRHTYVGYVGGQDTKVRKLVLRGDVDGG